MVQIVGSVVVGLWLITAIITGAVGLSKNGEDSWERFHERITFNVWDLSRESDHTPTTTPSSSGEPEEETSSQETSTNDGNSLESEAGSGGSPIGVLDGTTLPKGSAAIIRIINGSTATVCYSESLPINVYVGQQSDGDIVAAWAKPDRKPWGWMLQDATNEAEAIRNGSLGSLGVKNVDGPKSCS